MAWGRGPTSFCCLWISNFLNITCWKDHSSLNGLCTLVKNSFFFLINTRNLPTETWEKVSRPGNKRIRGIQMTLIIVCCCETGGRIIKPKIIKEKYGNLMWVCGGVPLFFFHPFLILSVGYTLQVGNHKPLEKSDSSVQTDVSDQKECLEFFVCVCANLEAVYISETLRTQPSASIVEQDGHSQTQMT